MPWDIQVSGSFRAVPGTSVAANYTVNSTIAGQPIVGGISNVTTISVNLVEPNTLFNDYQNQLDGRVGKTFRFGRFQAQGFVDIFNVLNAGTITAVNQTYGGSWNTPTAILTGRTIRFGTQWEF